MIRYRSDTKIRQKNLSNLEDSDTESTKREVMIKFRAQVQDMFRVRSI